MKNIQSPASGGINSQLSSWTDDAAGILPDTGFDLNIAH